MPKTIEKQNLKSLKNIICSAIIHTILNKKRLGQQTKADTADLTFYFFAPLPSLRSYLLFKTTREHLCYFYDNFFSLILKILFCHQVSKHFLRKVNIAVLLLEAEQELVHCSLSIYLAE